MRKGAARPKNALSQITPEFVAAFNRLTPKEAIDLLCRNEVTKRVSTLIAMTKSAIGMCVDEEPHDQIRGKLWEVVEMLYGLRSHAICGKR